jgi:hypothetical protein
MRRSGGRPAPRSTMPFCTSMVHRGIGHAPNLNETSVAGTLHYAAVVHSDVRVNQIAAKRPQWRERPVFVSACEPAKTNDVVGSQYRCECPRLGQYSDFEPLLPCAMSVHGPKLKSGSFWLMSPFRR